MVLWTPTFRKSSVTGYSDSNTSNSLVPVLDSKDFGEINDKLRDLGVKVVVKHFNENIHKVEVSYAYGYAFSEDYSECTMKTLFNKADKHMYENKAI